MTQQIDTSDKPYKFQTTEDQLQQLQTQLDNFTEANKARKKKLQARMAELTLEKQREAYREQIHSLEDNLINKGIITVSWHLSL